MEEPRDEAQKEMEKEMEKEIEKKVERGVSTGVAILVSVVVVFVISLILFKLVWAWVVPDLFPGAVDQGLIVADLTWLDAFKLAVLVAVLGGFYPALSDAFKQRA
jgi:TRAP-type uncharacterized transport system fused permease subunit